MRQPRTFSERLALLNRLNRRQAVLPEADEEEESEDEGTPGVAENDSGSELDDDKDDSDDNGSVSDSDSEGDFSGEEEEDEEEGEGEEEERTVLPTAPPTAGTPSPGVGQPEASVNPESPGGSMTVINPAPTGIANNPQVPPSVATPELSTTEQVVSQITGAAGAASTTTSDSPESNSLAQEEQEGTETASGVETSATGGEAGGGGGGGESSAQALGPGQQAGIVFGAIAGLGLLVSVGFALFKWRKRRRASVYDRPPPPGIYREEEKRDAEVAVTQAQDWQADKGAGRDGIFQVVNSWIQGTPNRYWKGAEVPAPAPALVTPARSRDTAYTGFTGFTGSEARWG